ncbi:single-strand DNA-binding protein [Kitasatospora gansuensis]|uniref:Single-stranded DNA-binding protein n=1 Tax=Kitasatospora gansuensis TaxID=258050 RepID=A0A7W7WH93_9ACTN|nr:single-stranded DNA-binding protein [Kitasatospora gansuensis]MBB4946455.1 single-strand DNA-binding protein [Kitasatospora gansuensis]
MNETMVTMIGNVATVVSYSQTAAGVPVANFRMAATERRYDREKGDWVDGETSWVTVTAWRWLAANVVSSLSKGDPVVVSGRLRVREWGEEEKRRCVVEIDARVVGHDLGRGTTAFRWAVQAKPELVLGRSGREESAALPAGSPAGLAGALPGPASAGQAVPGWIVAAVESRQAAVAAPAVRAAGAGEVAEEAAGVEVPAGVREVKPEGGEIASSDRVAIG